MLCSSEYIHTPPSWKVTGSSERGGELNQTSFQTCSKGTE